jgi:hypothetical protein
MWGIIFLAHELRLDDLSTRCGFKYVPFAAAPHMEMYSSSREETFATAKALVVAPFFKLSPKDIDVLESDPAKQQRYTELVEYTWLPALSRIERTFATQSHLDEPTTMEEFLATMPGDVTLTRAAASSSFGTTKMLIWFTQVYAEQLESLVGRWAGGDYDILQVRHSLPRH